VTNNSVASILPSVIEWIASFQGLVHAGYERGGDCSWQRGSQPRRAAWASLPSVSSRCHAVVLVG